jgi:hypothetical protein
MRKNLLAMLALLPLATAQADTMELKPGLWEVSSTTTMPMSSTPTKRVDSECVKEGKVFDPMEMAEGMDNCQMVENKRTGNTLNFRMNCTMEGNPTTAVGKLFTDGKTSSMDMDFVFKMGGMEMKMTMKSTGVRVGDC